MGTQGLGRNGRRGGTGGGDGLRMRVGWSLVCCD